MHVNIREDINDLLKDGYEVDDDQHPSPENKPSDRGQDTYKTRYKWVLSRNRIYLKRSYIYRINSAKLDGINKKIIRVFTYLTKHFLFANKSFIDEFILVETNQIIK